MTVENLPPPLPPMGQCMITGKIVPEDELVMIQGYRVCAEGKFILLQRLQSGEALPGESDKPSVWRRFGCLFVDGLVIGVPTGIAVGVASSMATGSSGMTTGWPMATSPEYGGLAIVGLVTVVAVALQIVYYGQMHGTRGQSLGKMAGKLFVINLDGSPITLKTGYVRALAYLGPNFISGLAYFTGSPIFVTVAGAVVGIYSLSNTIVALVDGHMQRAIHDRIAGTRVIVKE